MAMRAYKFRSTLLSTTSFAYTHMTYTVCKLYFISRISLETKVLPLIQRKFWASLIVMSNFEHYTTVVLLSAKLKDVSSTNTPQVFGIHSID